MKEHFGSAEAPTKDFSKLDAYWNIDDGTGRVRGASIFGPPEAAAILAQYFKPFEEWGIYGASASTARVEGGSDNGAFAVAGLPGIGTQQDNIEYNSTTWHTNLDTYERIVPEDVMKNAVITASVMLHLANRDQMLPRFSAGRDAGGAGGSRRRWSARGAATRRRRRIRTSTSARKNKPLTVPRPAWSTPAGAAAPRRHDDAPRSRRSPAHGKVAINAGRQLRLHAERGVHGNGHVHVHGDVATARRARPQR